MTAVTAAGVQLANGETVPAELVVWAAGVKAPAFLAQLDGLETNSINQLVVKPTLQTTGDDTIFAIGDCAAAPWIGQDATCRRARRWRTSRPRTCFGRSPVSCAANQ